MKKRLLLTVVSVGVAMTMVILPANSQDLLMLDTRRNVIASDLSERYTLSRKAKYGAAMQNSETLTQMQKKMAEGIDFYAVGNEPPWSLDIDFDKFMRFKSQSLLSELKMNALISKSLPHRTHKLSSNL